MGLNAFFKRKNKKKKQSAVPDGSENQIPADSRFSSLNGGYRMGEEELVEVFKKFDANGDGKICAAELGKILSCLGHLATEEELRMMIEEVDSDRDGFIDLREFIALNNADDSDNDEALRTAFEVFDLDKNGSISAEELHDVLKSLGEECTLDECRKMISGVDADGNGTICFDEFKVMMMNGPCLHGKI